MKAYWYDKLKESGFQDIEKADGSLKHPTTNITGYEQREYFRQLNRDNQIQSAITAREALSDYYRLAGHFLNEHTWATTNKKKKKTMALHRQVWELHVEGYPAGGIAAKLKITLPKTKFIIGKYKELMLGFKINK
jgi:hypothetical protein